MDMTVMIQSCHDSVRVQIRVKSVLLLNA